MQSIRYLAPDDYTTVLHTIRSDPGEFPIWFSDVLRTLWATGARPAEIVGRPARLSGVKFHPGLLPEDVLPGNLVRLYGKNTVGRKLRSREVICGDASTHAMLSDRVRFTNRGCNIFGIELTPSEWRSGYGLLTRAFDVLRGMMPSHLRDITPYWFRHSWAINALQHGVDLVTVQRQLGHRRLETTAAYLRFAPADKDRVMEVFTRM